MTFNQHINSELYLDYWTWKISCFLSKCKFISVPKNADRIPFVIFSMCLRSLGRFYFAVGFFSKIWQGWIFFDTFCRHKVIRVRILAKFLVGTKLFSPFMFFSLTAGYLSVRVFQFLFHCATRHSMLRLSVFSPFFVCILPPQKKNVNIRRKANFWRPCCTSR